MLGTRSHDAGAQVVRLTQDDALRLAFPRPVEIVRRTAFLADTDLDRARNAAGPDVQIAQAVVTYYVGYWDGRAVGVAYFDAHRVRSVGEVLMIVVTPAGTIGRIEVLKFEEPSEYGAGGRWLDQLEGKGLDRALSLKGAIVNMTGATLTSQAIVRAARRVLALHGVIEPLESEREEAR